MANDTCLRFYQANQPHTLLDAVACRTLFRNQDRPLAEQHDHAPGTGTLLSIDAQGSLLRAETAQEIRWFSHAAYGYRPLRDASGILTGFNGAVRDTATGWYLPGNGYRVYNTVLMRFHSSDAESPFASGGPNSYAYCQGDPVNFSDPSGRTPIRALKSLNHARKLKPPTYPQARRKAQRASRREERALLKEVEARWMADEARRELETATAPREREVLIAVAEDQNRQANKAKADAQFFRTVADRFLKMTGDIPQHEENRIPVRSAQIRVQSTTSYEQPAPRMENQRARQTT